MRRTVFSRVGYALLSGIPLLLALCVPALADYVVDNAALLTWNEQDTLEAQAAGIADEYRFAACICTVEDYHDYASTPRNCVEHIYAGGGLGIGPDHDGMLLLLSMDDRDFYLYAHGYGEAVFTDSRLYAMEDAFLDNFRENDWYGGFRDYLTTVVTYLRAGPPEEEFSYYGDPGGYVGYEEGPGTLLSVLFLLVIPVVLSLLICMALRSMMRTVHHASSAGNYVPDGGFRLRVSDDRFTHTTETRVRIEKPRENHGGGGGGGRGHGGKF